MKDKDVLACLEASVPGICIDIDMAPKEGGFSHIYFGRYHEAPAAIKIPREDTEDSRILCREIKKYQVVQVLDGIVKPLASGILDYSASDQMPYLVLPWFRETLDSLIPCMTARDTLDYLFMLASTIDDLHSKRNIVHNDVNPTNCFAADRLYLGDFGLSRMNSDQRWKSYGNIFYKPYEQCKGYAIFANDVYAFGVTALQTLLRIQFDDLTYRARTRFFEPEKEVIYVDGCEQSVLSTLDIYSRNQLVHAISRAYNDFPEEALIRCERLLHGIFQPAEKRVSMSDVAGELGYIRILVTPEINKF